MSENWARHPCLQLTEWLQAPLLFQIHVTGNLPTMGLVLVPVGEEALRRKIFDCVKKNPTAFNCQETAYKDDLTVLHAAEEILTNSD